MNRFNGENYQQSTSNIRTPTSDVFANSNGEIKKSPPNFSLLSRSFGQFTLQQPATQQSPTLFQDHNNIFKSNQSITSTLNQFARHSKDLPTRTFQRGSLIKLHDQTSMDV